MENANSPEYLEKIKIQVIENLKKTAHAPSVQMQDVPRDSLMGDLDEEEAELDDADEDENKDSRNTQRRWDKRVTREDELDESEDEEAKHANGIRPQNGHRKRMNIMDYQNPNSAEDMDVDSGIATPEAVTHVDANVEAAAIEANAEVNDEVMEKKQLDANSVQPAEKGPSNAASRADTPKPAVDEDGDVNMTEAAPTVDDVPAAPVTIAATTPPMSPSASATVAAPPKAESPATVQPETEPAKEASSTTVVDPVAAKEEGEVEREKVDVTGEATTGIVEQSQL